MNISRLGALALVASLAVPAAALAQGYGAPPPPMAAAPAPGPHGDMGQERQAHDRQRVQALHEVLRIRPDQETAFQAFVAAMHPKPPAGGWGHDGGPTGDHAAMAQMTTPQRLDKMAQMMDERESRRRAEFERRATATKALYAALGPEQRQIMDALPALEGHGGDGWGGGGGIGHGPHDGMRPMGPPPPPPSGE